MPTQLKMKSKAFHKLEKLDRADPTGTRSTSKVKMNLSIKEMFTPIPRCESYRRHARYVLDQQHLTVTMEPSVATPAGLVNSCWNLIGVNGSFLQSFLPKRYRQAVLLRGWDGCL